MMKNDTPKATSNGWITLHRSIRDHWIYSKSEYFSAWIKMLLEVNFKDSKSQLISGTLISCKRGQSTKSLDTWVKVFGRGWTKQKVRTFFKLLIDDGIINTENVKKTTRLTICNYNTYQLEQHDDNTTITLPQHDLNTTSTPIEEGKKVKKVKKVKKERVLFVPPTNNEVIEYIHEYCENKGLADSAEYRGITAEKFMNHNVQCDWRISGGKGAKMKEWKRAVGTWMMNEYSYGRIQRKV